MKKNVGAMTKPGVRGKQTVPSGPEASQAGSSLRRHAQYNEAKSRSVAEVTPRSTARPRSLGTTGSTGTKARSPGTRAEGNTSPCIKGTPSSGRATAPIRGEVPKEPVCQGQARRLGLDSRGQGSLGPRKQRPQEVPGSRVKGSPVLVPPGKRGVGPHRVSTSPHRGHPSLRPATSGTPTSGIPTSESPTSNSCPADLPSDLLTPSPLTSNSCPPKDLRPEFPTSDPMPSKPPTSISSTAKDLPSYLPTSDPSPSDTMPFKLLPSNPPCPTCADNPHLGSVPVCGEVNHSPKGHEGNGGVWATGVQGPGQSRGTGCDSSQQQPRVWQGRSGDLRDQEGAEPGVRDLAGSLGGVGGAQQAGERGPAQAGERGPAQERERGPAQAGERSPAQAGERSPAQERERGPAQAGEHSPAQEREHGPAQAGERGPAQAGECGLAQERERGPAQERERGPAQAGERGPAQEREHGPAQAGEWLGVQVTGDELRGEGTRLSRGCSVQGVCDGPSSLTNGDTETTAPRAAPPETSSESPSHSCSKVDCGEQGGTGEWEREVKDLQETIFELQDQVQQHQALQLHSDSTIRALECKVKSLERQNLELEKQLKMFNKKMKEEAEEWRYFQADLQTAVVVANDIKCEAQQEMRELRRELQEERWRNQQLQKELEAMQALRLVTRRKRSEPSLQ